MKIHIRRNRGISLVEVMIVFAVTSLLVAFSLPAYVNQAIKARTDEGLSQVSAAKSALVKTCETNRAALVTNNFDAGYFYHPGDKANSYISKILLTADCASETMVIVVWTDPMGARLEPILEWSADGSGDDNAWTCRVIQGDLRDVPRACRTSQKPI